MFLELNPKMLLWAVSEGTGVSLSRAVHALSVFPFATCPLLPQTATADGGTRCQ